MLRIEEIVGAMDDEFRYSLDALSDEKLAALAADKAALRRLRPVGVSNAEALAMIVAIQDKREKARNAPPTKPKKPRPPRKAKVVVEPGPEPEPEPPVAVLPPAPASLPAPAETADLAPPTAHGPAIRLGPPPQDGPVLITEPPPKPVPPISPRFRHGGRDFLVLLSLCVAAGVVIALL